MLVVMFTLSPLFESKANNGEAETNKSASKTTMNNKDFFTLYLLLNNIALSM